MQNANAIKQAIKTMLCGYCDIKNMHYFFNSDAKKEVILKATDKALNDFCVLLGEALQYDMPENIMHDLLAYKTWLLNLQNGYVVDCDISDISFKCRYELPHSGYDCLYLDYDATTPFLTLFD